MQIKKQFLGYNCQQVDGFLTASDKQEQDQLKEISAEINACQQKNQKRVAAIGILLQQIDDYRENQQAFTLQILEQVKILEESRSQANHNIDIAQQELAAKLDELTNSYHIIEDIKAKLAASYKQLAILKQSEDLINLYGKTSRREWD